eukprot:scaffold2557_cov121-Cylindrotheca_fusiformis.AAC.4
MRIQSKEALGTIGYLVLFTSESQCLFSFAPIPTPYFVQLLLIIAANSKSMPSGRLDWRARSIMNPTNLRTTVEQDRRSIMNYEGQRSCKSDFAASSTAIPSTISCSIVIR